MIVLICLTWIALLSPVTSSSNITNDVTMEPHDEENHSTITILQDNNKIKNTSLAENTNVTYKIDQDLTMSTELFVEKADNSENSTGSLLIITGDPKPDRHENNSSSLSKLQEETYMNDKTVTYQSTTQTSKSSTQVLDDDSDSSENLYFNPRVQIRNNLNSETTFDIPNLTTEISEEKTTVSTVITSEIPFGRTSEKELMSTETLGEQHTTTEFQPNDKLYISSNERDVPSHIGPQVNVVKLNVVNSNDFQNNAEAYGQNSEISADNAITDKAEPVYTDEKQNETMNDDADPAVENMTISESPESFPRISVSENGQTFTSEGPLNVSGIRKELYEKSQELEESREVPNDYKTTSTPEEVKSSSEIQNSDEITLEATEGNSNSTRIPKKIQGQDRYPEGRVRPLRPDPGFTHRQETDIVRPYRPDSPLHQYPYFRPTPDTRTPLIRQDIDFTRPARPDPDYQKMSFKPNYSYSKTSQDDDESSKVSPVSEASPQKPYRPSFNRPYHAQTSFGRPYRPEYQRPASKPTAEPAMTSKINIGYDGISKQDSENFEHSRPEYDYTRQAESFSDNSKNYQSDVRPSQLKPDVTKPLRPVYDAVPPIHSDKPSITDTKSEILDTRKSSKPDIETGKTSSYYPRPGFGHNYQSSDTSVRPFSVGTVTSAKNITRVEYIKADCFDNHMKVTMRFNGTFNGLVYSAGYAQDNSCSYVNGSGRNHYEFFIRLNRCGTLGQQEVAEQRSSLATRPRQDRAQYLVNTVTVQYNPLIEEDIDEHFRVTCEYGYDFWKTVTFPVINVESAAVKVRTGSPVVFTLPPPQCNMEIRSGYGPSGNRVSGPVNVGDPLTLVIHMKSESTGFDILVSNCFAHNGAQKRLQLIDSNGCVVQEKLVSPFRGVSSPDRSQQVTLYSYLKAFRFTGSPALYIECDVHMCHGSCPPQRCYWRHLYKRSADSLTEDATTTESTNVMSESVSLFQSLEVRHEEADSKSLSLRTLNVMDIEDLVCMRTAGFATIFACLLLLLLISSCISLNLSLRMRKMKSYIDAPDTKEFVEFDGHVPMK